MPKLDPSHPWGTDDGEFACRPVFSRLPAESYGYRTDETEELSQDPSNWITDFPDEQLCQIKYHLFSFYELYLDCKTAKAEVLDWLAQLHGFTGEYWSSDWPENFKRALLCNSYEIWLNKGTEWLFNWFLEQYNIQTCTDPIKVWRCQDFLAGETRMDSPIKKNGLESFVRLPLGATSFEPYRHDSEEWKLLRRWIRQYMPAYAIAVVNFCYFYAGESRTGDGVFDPVLERAQGSVPMGVNYVEEFASRYEQLSVTRPLEYFANLLAYLLLALELSGNVEFLEFRADATAIPAPLGVDDIPGGAPCVENPAVFARISPDDELYRDYQETWIARERLVQLYRPFQEMWEVNCICHDYFYAGKSAPSHPEFDLILDATRNDAIIFYSHHSALAATEPIPYFVQLLTHLGSLLTLSGQVQTSDGFRAGLTAIPAPLGNGEDSQNQVFWRISDDEDEDRWRARMRLVELHRPFLEIQGCEVVCRDYFRAGMSAAHHPVFDPIWEETIGGAIDFYRQNQGLSETDPWGYFRSLLQYLFNWMGFVNVAVNQLIDDVEIILPTNADEEMELTIRQIYDIYCPFV